MLDVMDRNVLIVTACPLKQSRSRESWEGIRVEVLKHLWKTMLHVDELNTLWNIVQ